MKRKGPDLEEIVRTYFHHQGFFAVRGTPYRFEDELVTDIDVWLYGRQSASVRTRTIVDVKNKRSPKAFERILWVRGMQLALGCDRAIVATTDGSAKVAGFAHQQQVQLLTKDFLSRLQNRLETSTRMTLEQFIMNIQKYEGHKRDGNWLRRISNAKSALVSLQGYRAFNRAIAEFGFFAERVETRRYHREQALRAAYLTAALACAALDSALERVVYDDQESRYGSILNGVTYGDTEDATVQRSIKTVLGLISRVMEHGRVISRQAEAALHSMFEDIRPEIIAEYFVKEHNSAVLVKVARELDEHAHKVNPAEIGLLSTEAKSILGVYADFVQVKRSALLSNPTKATETNAAVHSESASTISDTPRQAPKSNETDLFRRAERQ